MRFIYWVLFSAVFSVNAAAFKLSETVNINNIEADESIVALAHQVLSHPDFSKARIRQKIAISLVSQNYAGASKLINQLTEQSRTAKPWIAELYTLHYRAFVDAKILQKTTAQPFEQAFTTSLLKANAKVNKRYSVYSADSFGGNVKRQKRLLTGLISEFSGKTLDFKQAKSIIVQLNAWSLLNQTQSLAAKILKKEADKHYTELNNLTINLKDGTSLDATVYLPTGQIKKRPSLLIYNLYAQWWSIDTKAKEAAMSGYAGVLVYPRGKGNSTGAIAPFETEAQDAYEIIDWISKQPWSDQQVGMYGGSYLGFAQWAATKKLHPALKTIVPSTAVVPGYNDNLTENGVLSTNALPWFHLVGNNPTMDFGTYYDPRWQDTQQRWFKEGAAFSTLDEIDGHPNALFQRWLAHPHYDKYWQSMVPYQQDFSHINIPILSTTGYFDHAQHGSTYFFKQHYKFNNKAKHYLLIGPWDHLGAASMPGPTIGPFEIDPIAHISIDKVIYEWFDFVLKGQPRPAIIKDKVNYQVIGTNQWRHAPTLAAMANGKLKYYLNLNDGKTQQQLTLVKPAKPTHKKQTVDFADRKTVNDSMSANILSDSLQAIVQDGNGIKLISEPLLDSIDLSGQFTGQINVEINKADMDFVVVLFELLANGQYFKLSHFKGRASYLNSPSKRQLLSPNTKQALVFNNTHVISKKIAKGSRLVVVINANKNADDQINYGSGKPVNEETLKDAAEPLTIKWLNDSFISIPISTK